MKKEKESYPYTRKLVMKFKWMGQGNPLTVPPSHQIVRWGRGLGPPLTVPSPEETPDTEQNTALLKAIAGPALPGLICTRLPPSHVHTHVHTNTHMHTWVPLVYTYFFESSYCSGRKPGRLFDPYCSEERTEAQTRETSLSRSPRTKSEVFQG